MPADNALVPSIPSFFDCSTKDTRSSKFSKIHDIALHKISKQCFKKCFRTLPFGAECVHSRLIHSFHACVLVQILRKPFAKAEAMFNFQNNQFH